MDWELYAYATRTKQRREILKMLAEPHTPTAIGKATGIRPSQVSRTLSEFVDNCIAKCQTPKLRVGRLYNLTREGTEILKKLK